MVDVCLRTALEEQEELISGRPAAERCSVAPELLTDLGIDAGTIAALTVEDADINSTEADPWPRLQIRVTYQTRYALYTVVQAREKDDADVIRMGQRGRNRLGGIEDIPADVTIDTQVVDVLPASAFTEHVAGIDEGTALVVIAPHGGRIEPYTDVQAEHVVWQLAVKGKRSQSWVCKGYRLGADADATFARWHITSNDISRASFPLLNLIMSPPFTFAHAVSFHGFTPKEDQEDILIGGNASATLKDSIRTKIKFAVADDFSVGIESEGDDRGGNQPSNLVNRLAGGNGIQVEQRYEARVCCWREIARAVTRAYDEVL
jgi:phage replication-related protein YjqB (UPF0714/DUF867 family)